MKHSDNGPRSRNGYPRECHAVRMRIVDGELWYKQIRLRTDYVTDATEAIRLLRQGRTIWALEYGPLITAIQRGLAA